MYKRFYFSITLCHFLRENCFQIGLTLITILCHLHREDCLEYTSLSYAISIEKVTSIGFLTTYSKFARKHLGSY